jgi:hypothetical protein
MPEQRLNDKQFELLLQELTRVADELELVRRRLALLEAIPPAVEQLARLSNSLEALAYAAIGREGPRVRRHRA